MTFRTVLRHLAVLTIGLTLTTTTSATIIDTYTPWDKTSAVSYFGDGPVTETVGQSFTVDSHNILQSFSFWIGADPNPQDFAGYIVEWDSVNLVAVGPLLHQSTTRTTPASGGFTEFNFQTGGLQLTQGKEYMAFISTSGFADGVNSQALVGYTQLDLYPGGGLRFLVNNDDLSLIYTNEWEDLNIPVDLAFTAEFTAATAAVPEPATAAMLALGAGVLGLTSSRRGRKA